MQRKKERLYFFPFRVASSLFILFSVYGSQEPLTPRARTFDSEDGKQKYGTDFVALDIDSKAQVQDQDLKSATSKDSGNSKN